MRPLLSAFCLAITLLIGMPQSANAQVLDCTSTPAMPTCSCSTLGETRIASDRTSIIACTLITANTAPNITCATAGGCRWKAMTSSTAASVTCGPKEVLTGIDTKGSAICTKDITCPDGKFFKGINKDGEPICGTLKTQQVFCNMVYFGLYKAYHCIAQCPEGTFVTGGGFLWGTIYSDNGTKSQQDGNGWHCYNNIDSCSSGSISTACNHSKCQATCASLD